MAARPERVQSDLIPWGTDAGAAIACLYESLLTPGRRLDETERNGVTVSTIYAYDQDWYETAVWGERFALDHAVVVEQYGDDEDAAQEGHDRWLALMSGPIEHVPLEIVDVGSGHVWSLRDADVEVRSSGRSELREYDRWDDWRQGGSQTLRFYGQGGTVVVGNTSIEALSWNLMRHLEWCVEHWRAEIELDEMPSSFSPTVELRLPESENRWFIGKGELIGVSVSATNDRPTIMAVMHTVNLVKE